MENKMAEVAKLLGVELNEEFRLKAVNGINSSYGFKLTMEGLQCKWKNSSKWNSSGLLEDFITGRYQIAKETNSVLDEAEKRYLTNIIKPFRKKVEWIKKYSSPTENFEYIRISYQDHNYSNVLNFPDFKAGTMYRGMKLDKLYTLKELGL